jgi:hypothetical protein
MGICIYCIDKSADTLYLEKGANRFVQAVGNISQSEINSWSHNIPYSCWCAEMNVYIKFTSFVLCSLSSSLPLCCVLNPLA